MEMYLCRRCFISVRALREIKISLCLWEERGRGGEGQSVCINVCVCEEMKSGCIGVFFPPLLQMSVCVFVHDRGCNSHVVQSKTSRQKKNNNVTKGAKPRADVSHFRHSTVKSSQIYLLTSSPPPSHTLSSSLLPPAPSSKQHCRLL